MTVTLINSTNRMRVFNLPHGTYCEALGKCTCTVLPGREKRRVPSSLTLPGKSKIKNLPEAVLAAPDVAKAVKAEILVVKAENKKQGGSKKHKVVNTQDPEPKTQERKRSE